MNFVNFVFVGDCCVVIVIDDDDDDDCGGGEGRGGSEKVKRPAICQVIGAAWSG